MNKLSLNFRLNEFRTLLTLNTSRTKDHGIWNSPDLIPTVIEIQDTLDVESTVFEENMLKGSPQADWQRYYTTWVIKFSHPDYYSTEVSMRFESRIINHFNVQMKHK